MIKESSFLKVICREFRLLKQRKSFLAGMILIPLVSFVFLLTFFGNSELRKLPIAVVDKDNSTLTRKLTRMYDATAGLQVKYMPQSVEEAKQMMFDAKVDAVVYLPEGIQKDVYSGTTAKPIVWINATRYLGSSLMFKDLLYTSYLFNAGVEMQLLTSSGKSPSEAYGLAVPIKYEKHVLFNPYLSYGYYLISPFNMLFLLICAITWTLFSVGLEYKEQTAQDWLDTAGGSPYTAVFAKILPYTLYFSMFFVVANFVIYAIYKAPLNDSIWELSLLGFLVIFAYQAVGLIFFVLAKKLMVAMSFSAAITTMSFTMAGLTFPLIAMAKPIYYLAHLFPYTYYIEGYVDILRGSPQGAILKMIAVLLIYTVIVIVVTPFIVKRTLNPYNE